MVGDAEGGAERRDRVSGGGAMGEVERDYMWNTLGIRDWIVKGGIWWLIGLSRAV